MGNAQTAQARRAPSVIRDELCASLWNRVVGHDPMVTCPLVLGQEDVEVATACGDEEARCVREIMTSRACATREERFCGQVL